MTYAIYQVQVGDDIHTDFVTHHKDALSVFTQFLEFVYNLENFGPASSPVELNRWVEQNAGNMSLIELDVLDDIDELVMDKLVTYIDQSTNANDIRISQVRCMDDNDIRISQVRHDCMRLANTRLSDTWLEADEATKLKWLTEARVIINTIIPSLQLPRVTL